jgi:hypothetical protein
MDMYSFFLVWKSSWVLFQALVLEVTILTMVSITVEMNRRLVLLHGTLRLNHADRIGSVLTQVGSGLFKLQKDKERDQKEKKLGHLVSNAIERR